MIEKKGKHVIDKYIYTYPQLTLSVSEGMDLSPEYRDIVLRGKSPSSYPCYFAGTEEDCIMQPETPVGIVEAVYLADRNDFERIVQCLAYKCRPVVIPETMGAITLSGIPNWKKIYERKREYLSMGGTDWKAEFKQFTARPENYKDTLIIVTKGGYSALDASETNFTEEEWEKRSLELRLYHELTHVVCRHLYSELINPIRDEIVADCFGIQKAIGYYDTVLAEKCLGVQGDIYHAGGRLENYVKDKKEISIFHEEAKQMIRELESCLKNNQDMEYWGRLIKIQETLHKQKQQVPN